jgi:hypothetical protein
MAGHARSAGRGEDDLRAAERDMAIAHTVTSTGPTLAARGGGNSDLSIALDGHHGGGRRPEAV